MLGNDKCSLVRLHKVTVKALDDFRNKQKKFKK